MSSPPKPPTYYQQINRSTRYHGGNRPSFMTRDFTTGHEGEYQKRSAHIPTRHQGQHQIRPTTFTATGHHGRHQNGTPIAPAKPGVAERLNNVSNLMRGIDSKFKEVTQMTEKYAENQRKIFALIMKSARQREAALTKAAAERLAAVQAKRCVGASNQASYKEDARLRALLQHKIATTVQHEMANHMDKVTRVSNRINRPKL